MKSFNTAGPNQPDIHYQINPLSRWNLTEMLHLIDNRKYFILHAPRQTGKTTCMLSLMNHLSREGKYKALYVNIEAAQAARENTAEAMRAILSRLSESERIYWKTQTLEKEREAILNRGIYDSLSGALTVLAENSEKPVILFIDEIDALIGDTLISVLRQIRSGYAGRPEHFPQSLVLCGVRDVRDYRIHSSSTKEIITGGSAFNIKAESLRLGNFSKEEIITLYSEHTKETGQEFHEEIFPLVWEYTDGQPWLVNALAYEMCFRIPEGKDRSRRIDAELLQCAKENLILRRDTHLDQLTDKLQEDRIRRVILPILLGNEETSNIPSDDIQYAIDLGLVKREKNLKISNSIYAEIIPRELTFSAQVTMVQEDVWYLDSRKRIQFSKLLSAFQDFFRKNSESWMERFDYKEAGPQLLLQAFLQRIINGGGYISREYGLGRRRTDLHITWFPEGKNNYAVRQETVIELKIQYDSLESVLKDGLPQTADYADKCGAEEAHLLIFNRNPNLSWTEKIFSMEKEFSGKKIFVWGM